LLTYVARRFTELVFVLVAVLVLAFAASRLMPGDPIGAMLSDRAGDAALEQRLRAEYGLDAPVLEQFLIYVRGIARGEFGLSYRFVGVPVVEVLGDSLGISPLLALSALFIAAPLGVAAGALAALRHNRWTDTSVMAVMITGISVPNFASAAFLVYLLAVRLNALPVAGWGTLRQAVLPVIVLALQPTAYIARLARTFMLEVLAQDYIRTARAKGMGQGWILFVHALKNAAVPIVTVIGIGIALLIGGAVVTESVFAIPGLGRLTVDAILRRDYPLIQGIVLLFSFVYVIVNLVVDLVYTMLDPRIRY
jgi:ABC-type dipeptide/oligopeptide/nickel transport system permease component